MVFSIAFTSTRMASEGKHMYTGVHGLVHQYWQVGLDRVWGIVKKDLPDFVQKLKRAGAGLR
jgi:uncharacterized protein with HEPN domain